MCGDATDWNESAYRESILKEREVLTQTVFRTAWPPGQDVNPETIVVASSDGAVASYSISANSPFGVNNLSSQKLSADSNWFIQAHNGPVYDVKFYGDDEDALLLSCGDDGRIQGWRWKELSSSEVSLPLQGNHVKPALSLVNDQHRGPWGALSPIPENNAIAVDPQGGSLFSASGDSCAYCWDVETGRVKLTFKGHSDYLHCISSRKSANQIITGSEDGTARIWDCRTGKCIHFMEPAKITKFNGGPSHVSSIALDSNENWMACCIGTDISIWNLPAFESISRFSTRAPVQDAVFDYNQILAVGVEPLLNRFDMDGNILSQIQCAPSSAFSVSLHPSGVTAVGGYGGLVDVISQFGSHMCTFRCKSA